MDLECFGGVEMKCCIGVGQLSLVSLYSYFWVPRTDQGSGYQFVRHRRVKHVFLVKTLACFVPEWLKL